MSSEPVVSPGELEDRIARHLAHRLGVWPPRSEIDVVGSALRDVPDWDGVVRPVLGIGTASGTVVSVPAAFVEEIRELAASGFAPLSDGIGAVLGRPGVALGVNDFRYLREIVELDALGEWVVPEDPRIPSWLRPFNGGVLIACDEDNRYMAGVGLKLRDEFASEIAVG